MQRLNAHEVARDEVELAPRLELRLHRRVALDLREGVEGAPLGPGARPGLALGLGKPAPAVGDDHTLGFSDLAMYQETTLSPLQYMSTTSSRATWNSAALRLKDRPPPGIMACESFERSHPRNSSSLAAVSSYLSVVKAPQAVHLQRWDPDEVLPYWMARKRYEYSDRAIILATIAISLDNAGLGLLAVLLNEQKDLARIVSCVLVQCIVGGILYIVNPKHARKAFCWDYVKFALLFNLPLLPHYAAMYVLDAFDRIMIQTMVGFSAAALYSVACNLGNVLKIVTNSINNSIVPWMYEKLGQGEYEKLGKTTTAVIVIPVVPVLMLIAVGPEIIWLFGGNEYASAQYVIPPIAEALVFSFTYTAFTNIEFFFDKNKFVMFASIVASVLNVALNYLLIGPFGYVAAAYTTLLCYAFMAAAHYIYVRRLFAQKKIKCPFSGMVLVGMALLLVGLGFVLTLLYPYTLVRLVFFAVCLVALFVFRKKIGALLKSFKKKR